MKLITFIMLIVASSFSSAFIVAPGITPQRTSSRDKCTCLDSTRTTGSNTPISTSEGVSELQKRAAIIAESFQRESFDPLPFTTNTHFQTIAGVFLRKVPECAYVSDLSLTFEKAIKSLKEDDQTEGECDYWDYRERVATPDGDFFDVDHKIAKGESQGQVLIIHGLESNSNSSLCVEMARAYEKIGLNVACLNFRGCSGTL
jgi:predicted alpha/beta-fold hydrolase